MFDVTKSKLYSQIMAGLASFFSLGADATESEVHDALDGKATLAEQLQAARDEAAAAQSAQLADIQAQISAMKDESAALREEVATLRSEMEGKDARIAEMQVEAANYTAQIEALKAQHKTEIATLAGQLSALKAGATTQQDEETAGHFAAAGGSSKGITAIKSEVLSALLNPRK